MMNAKFAQILKDPPREKIREALELIEKTCERMEKLAEEYRREAKELRRDLDGTDDP